ncbi:hypothetical protein BJV78DRAFT_1185335 [Lactifluus subvellereus]|nr:hypothetical protein BJV78DRAFT_1185335 [Lactifluus subvellereus]
MVVNHLSLQAYQYVSLRGAGAEQLIFTNCFWFCIYPCPSAVTVLFLCLHCLLVLSCHSLSSPPCQQHSSTYCIFILRLLCIMPSDIYLFYRTSKMCDSIKCNTLTPFTNTQKY